MVLFLLPCNEVCALTNGVALHYRYALLLGAYGIFVARDCCYNCYSIPGVVVVALRTAATKKGVNVTYQVAVRAKVVFEFEHFHF